MKYLLSLALLLSPLVSPAETYTNGTTIRVAVGDSVYNQLRSAWKLSGSTNAFWTWATGTTTNITAEATNIVHINVQIVLSVGTAQFLTTEANNLGQRVSGLGGGPKDASILYRIKTAVEPQTGD